jgi:hypothetical protein
LCFPLRRWQISTTKGTGGDIIILEEAAYIDPGFFYVSPSPYWQFHVAAGGAVRVRPLI